MKVFTVNVESVGAGEEVRADFIVEQRKGEVWNRMRVVTVTSGSPDSQRRFVLQDNERLLLEGQTNKVVVYDREQNMSKIVDADPEVREKQEVADAAQREANIAREGKHNEVSAGLATQAEQEKPKTNLGNPAPQPNTGLPLAAPPQTPHHNASSRVASGGQAGPVSSVGRVAPTTNTDTGQGAKDSKEVKK